MLFMAHLLVSTYRMVLLTIMFVTMAFPPPSVDSLFIVTKHQLCKHSYVMVNLMR